MKRVVFHLKEHAVKPSPFPHLCTALALLAACAVSPAVAQTTGEHDHDHAAAAPAKPAAAVPAKPQHQGAGNSKMDMQAMCDMHKEMMSAPSASERQAMAERKMKGMSPADKKKHMKMMDEHCK